MDLKALQREAHAIAKDHGWWDTERTFGDLIALVHSKLSEALEAYRELGTTKTAYTVDADGALTKPEGVPYELADVVIRVADMAEGYGVDLAHEVGQLREYNWTGSIYDQISTFGEWIVLCHYQVSTAMLHQWGEHPSFPGSRPWRYLALLVKYVQLMAAHYGIDLDAAIEAKIEYNRGREYRHGGKAL